VDGVVTEDGADVLVSVAVGAVEDCDVVASFAPHPAKAMVRAIVKAVKISKMPIFFIVSPLGN